MRHDSFRLKLPDNYRSPTRRLGYRDSDNRSRITRTLWSEQLAPKFHSSRSGSGYKFNRVRSKKKKRYEASPHFDFNRLLISKIGPLISSKSRRVVYFVSFFSRVSIDSLMDAMLPLDASSRNIENYNIENIDGFIYIYKIIWLYII